MEVKINREIRDYTEAIFFGLSLRQFFFSLAAVLVAVGIYFGLRSHLGTEALTIIHYAERGKPYAFHVMAPKEHLPFGKRSGNEMKFAVTWYRPRKGKKWRRG